MTLFLPVVEGASRTSQPMGSITQLVGQSTSDPTAVKSAPMIVGAPALKLIDPSANVLAARLVTGLDAASLDGLGKLRGAKDVQRYRQYSPSVALILTEDSVGSGFVVSSDGKIVTNYHVVGESRRVVVVFKPVIEGATLTKADAVVATVIRVDQEADLALLKPEKIPPHVKPLSLGPLTSVQVGADVSAIGHPTGESWSYTKGIVSQVRRGYKWRTESGLEHSAAIIQTQTPINPGNSGGPLIDESGLVIGVNSFKGSGEGMNYAVSADDVRAFLNRGENRFAASVAPPKNERLEAASGSCEPEVIRAFRGDDKKSDRSLVDFNCDGRAEAVLIIPDDVKEPIETHLDTNGDGKIDVVLIDEDRDGNPEAQVADTNGDGKGDIVGFYRNGENTPYRYERV